MKKSGIISLFLASCMAAGILAGCQNGGGKAPASSAESQSKAKNVTLRINWWGGQERADITQKVIEMYKTSHPNVTISPEFSSFDGYWEKMAAMSAANRLPDVFQHDLRYLKQYVDKGLMLDMTSYVGKQFQKTDIPDVMLGSGTFNGKLYAVPLGTNMLCVVYDPALFAKAGIPEPTNDWTWDDYKNICLKIKQKLNIYGDGEYPGLTYNGWNYVLKQQGMSMYKQDGSALGFSDDKPISDMLKLHKELYKAGAVPPPSITVEIQDPESELIVTEKAAMASAQWTNLFNTISSVSKRPLKLVLPPKAADQKQYGNYIKPAQFFGVAASSAAPAEAVSFIDYFTNNIEANKVLKAERGVPINSKVREALAKDLPESSKLVFDFIAGAEKYVTDVPPAPPSIHSEVESLINTISFKVEEGSLKPEDAAAYFKKEVEQLYKNKK